MVVMPAIGVVERIMKRVVEQLKQARRVVVSSEQREKVGAEKTELQATLGLCDMIGWGKRREGERRAARHATRAHVHACHAAMPCSCHFIYMPQPCSIFHAMSSPRHATRPCQPAWPVCLSGSRAKCQGTAMSVCPLSVTLPHVSQQAAEQSPALGRRIRDRKAGVCR